MSVINAISGIIVVGALLQIGSGSGLVSALAFVAVLIATINIVGGFTVTQRMLKMFRKGLRTDMPSRFSNCFIHRGSGAVHCQSGGFVETGNRKIR